MNDEISKYVFELGEENIYDMLDVIKDSNAVDKSLVYCYIKALYLHTLVLYYQHLKMNIDFENIYNMYKENLKQHFKLNNPEITNELLDDILNFFDNSYSLIDSVELIDIDDSYEFRHYIINVFEILRIILEKKSNSNIRGNIFENYTKLVVENCDKIIDFVISKKK